MEKNQFYRSLFIFGIFLTSSVNAQQVETEVLERHKDIVEHFFELANQSDVEALREILHPDYIEHANLPDGPDGLMQVIAENSETPVIADAEQEQLRIRGEIVRLIAEEDQVWVFSQVRGEQARVARIDMFRLEDGLLAEHWGLLEQVNEERVNSNDHFALGRGPQDFREQEKRITRPLNENVLESNKDVVRTFYQSREAGDIEMLREIMREDYIQHNPEIANGSAPLLTPRRTSLAPTDGRPYCPNEIVRLLAEGDLVWAFIRGECGSRLQLNQYRLENGQLAEQWGMYQTVPEVKANTNNWFGTGSGPVADFSKSP